MSDAKRPGWMAAALLAATAAGYGTHYSQVTFFPEGELPADADGWNCAPKNGQMICRPKPETVASLVAPARPYEDAWTCTRADGGDDLCRPTSAPAVGEWIEVRDADGGVFIRPAFAGE